MIIFSAVFLYIGVPLLYGHLSMLLLRRRAANSRALVLTFDDGPGSRLTPAILAVLAEWNVKATFFLLGKNISGREHIVRRIAAEGHEVCSHGYGHLDYWKVSPLRTIRDIRKGWDSIEAALGTTHCRYPFRPPAGRLNIVSLLYLVVCGVPVVYWSVDLGDTWLNRVDTERISQVVEKMGGAVSLAHDFDRGDQSVEQLIVESIRLTLSMAKENGMCIVTVSELFRMR